MRKATGARVLTAEERRKIEKMAQSEDEDRVRRARIILLSAEGQPICDVAGACDSHPVNVKKWIQRFNERGLAGLEELKRGPKKGSRTRFTDAQEQAILDLARREPRGLGYRFKRWSPQKLADAAVERGIVDGISHVTVRGMLRAAGLDVRRKSGSASREASPRSEGGDGLHLIEAGRDALDRSENREAAELFRKALERDGLASETEASLRCSLAEALEGLSDYDGALDAVRMYEEAPALGLLPPSLRSRVKIRLGWIYGWMHNYPRAIARFNEALKICMETEDRRGMAEAHYALGRTYREFKEISLARDHLERAIELHRDAPDRHFLANVFLRRGTVEFDEGYIDRAIDFWEQARDLAESSRDDNLQGLIAMNLGVALIHADRGERDRATRYLEEAIHWYERSGNRTFLAQAYNNLGDNLRFAGDWARAVECLEKALAIGREANDPLGISLPLITLSEIAFRRGDYEEAERHLNEALDLVRKIGYHWIEAYTLRILGCLYARMDRQEEALDTLREALRMATIINDLRGVPAAQLLLADLHLENDRYEQAEEYLQLALGALASDTSQLRNSGLVRRIGGRLEFARGRVAEAQQQIAQSISIFTAVADVYEIGCSHMQLGELLLRIGEQEQAHGHLDQAATVFRTLGAEPDLERVEAIRSLRRGVGSVVASNSTERHRASDILLMQRLIDASASRELLLQELISIVEETFAPGPILLLSYRDDGTVLAELARGIDEIDLEAEMRRVREAVETGRALDTGNTFTLEDRAGGRVVLYLATTPPVDRLRPLLRQAELGLENCALREMSRHSSDTVRERLRPETIIPGFIYVGGAMREVIDRIHKIRTSDVTVLITGESGTGKELVARAVHSESERREAVFLPFNCTATPKEMIDSQLFGHRKGSFTGATSNYPGIIRAAEGGTLFLDEIGDLALDVQPKLLRFLESGEIQPLGEATPAKVDVRVVAATNTDLERAVEEGRFREDLFHRLNIIRIHVPPLRERREEIPVLADYFLKHFAERSSKPGLRLSEEVVDELTNYTWPGNVRQLRNEMERVVAYGPANAKILSEDLSPELVGRGTVRRRHAVGPNGSRRTSGPLEARKTLKNEMDLFERTLIEEALGRTGQNLSQTARDLGLSMRALHVRMSQLGIHVPARHDATETNT